MIEGAHVDLPRTEWPVNGNGTTWAFLRSGVITSTHSGAVAASKVPSRISTGTSLTIRALTAASAFPTFQTGHSVKSRPCLGCTFSTRSGNPGSAAFAFANVAASVVRLALSAQNTSRARPTPPSPTNSCGPRNAR